MMNKKIILLLIIISLFLTILPAGICDKGKIASSFVAIQSDILEDYRYDQDVIFKIRARAYTNGIPKREDIIITIYDSAGRSKLETITPNPMTVHAGQVTEVNMGHCEVGLYRAIIKGQGAGQVGDLMVQWVVTYPPTAYYFSWFDVGDLFTGMGKVKAEFQSSEKYLIEEPVWDINHTEIIDTKVIEKFKPFTLHFYYLDKHGGQKTLLLLKNVTGGSWEFDDVYDGGIYCELIDIHDWIDNKWWLGARKSAAAPQYPLDRIIIALIVVIILILIVKRVMDWNWGIKDAFPRRKSK